MPKYEFEVYETHINTYVVEGDDVEHALDNFYNGDIEDMGAASEYLGLSERGREIADMCESDPEVLEELVKLGLKDRVFEGVRNIRISELDTEDDN